MRRALVGLAVLAIAGLCPTWAFANDQQIAQTIVNKMKSVQESGKLRGFRIDLEVDQGTVWMKGTVASAEQERLCLDIARFVPGVRQVVDDIEVSNVTHPVARTRTGSSDELDEYVVQSIVDRVRARQQVGELGGLSVDLFCKDGVVRMTGDVPSAQHQLELLDIARRVDGVRQVVNGMTVSGTASPMIRPASVTEPQMARPAQIATSSSSAGLPIPIAPASMSRVSNQQVQHGAPRVAHLPSAAGAVGGAAQFDSPQMPGYAWPSYAAHPNYAGVTYPGQYSASAWPYIGPFYPYPQVPLGWRKVSLEWDDGWWYLDFWDKSY